MKIESDFIPSPRLVAIGLFIFFILSSLLLLLTKFAPFMDEAIFFDMTTRMMQGSNLSTTLFRDFIPGVEINAFWYPPIYFFSLAPIFWIFGAKIVVMRLFSLVAALFAIASIYFIGKKITGWRWAGIVAVCILVFDHYFQTGAMLGRMELLAIAFGCGAITFHLHFLERKRQLFNLLSGFLLAASCLTHPTGIVFALPIGLNMLFLGGVTLQKKIIDLIVLIIPSIVGVGIWLLSVSPHWESFILQNQLQMHRKEFGEIYVWNLLKYSPEQRWVLVSYFLSNAIFLFQAIIQKKLSSAPIRLLFFLVISSTFFAVILKEMWYVVYIPLIGALAAADNINWLWKKNRTVAIVLFSLFILPSLFIYFPALQDSVTRKAQYKPLSEKISQALPQNSHVLLSSIPDPYFYLVENRPDLNLRQTPNSPPAEPIDKDVYSTILNQTEYVVFSIAVNVHLYEYYGQNVESSQTIETDNGGYSVQIIKLKSLDQRKDFAPTTAKFWNYPEVYK